MCSARLAAAVSLVSFLAVSSTAWAQTTEGFAIDRFAPAERGSDWFSAESLDFRGHGRLAAGLTLDYANSPLVAYDHDGTITARIVRHQGFAHVGAAVLFFDRLRLGANMPILLLNRGEPVLTPEGDFATDEGAALGDARLGADVLLWGEYGQPFSLATGAQVFLPTGNQAAYASDGTVRVLPRLMAAGEIGSFSYAASAGAQLRPTEHRFVGAELGHEAVATAAMGVRLLDRALLIGPELRASTTLSDALHEGSTPLEALLGGHYVVADDFRISLGCGPGLTEGLGSPRLRAVMGLEWSPIPHPPADSDADGVPDSSDLCPAIPTGVKRDLLRLGCPAPDTDLDGILDTEDACPTLRGEANPSSALHGCPSPPPPPPPPADRDGDAIPDPSDACPDEVGIAASEPEAHGCPAARLEVALQQIRILQRIEFAYDSDRILGQSESVLGAVHDILVEHPEISLVEIQGHTDNTGTPTYNTELSKRRAEAVRFWLIAHGVERSHLTARGIGQDVPLEPNDTPRGRQANRRVEFHILEENGKPVSAPADGAPNASGSDEAPGRDGGVAEPLAPRNE